jgi:hypothetical protein
MSVTGAKQVGGLIGYTEGIGSYGGIALTDTYAQGAVAATSVALPPTLLAQGGLIGVFDDASFTSACTVTNSYASGAISGTDTIGGLVGMITGANLTCTNTFYDTTTTGTAVDACGAAATITANMQIQGTFDPPWDFAAIWQILASAYPSLQWEP